MRRSLAALLVDEVGLVAVTRNLAKADGSAHFGLDPASETRLRDWMQTHLLLST